MVHFKRRCFCAQTHGPPDPPVVSTLPAEVREERIYNGGPPSCWGLGWRVNHPGARHIINIILTQRIAPCSGTPDLLSLHCSVCYAMQGPS